MNPATLKRLGKKKGDEALALQAKIFDLLPPIDAVEFREQWSVAPCDGGFRIEDGAGQGLKGIESQHRDVIRAVYDDVAANLGR